MRYSIVEAGLHLGYPFCCAVHFSKHLRLNGRTPIYPPEEVKDKPWMGTGFIPCPVCREVADIDFPKFIKERIMPYRRTDIPPFPDFHDDFPEERDAT